MFAISRQCSEVMNEFCLVKAKVTLQIQISNGNILCLLYNFKII